jgi:hypothetical protein
MLDQVWLCLKFPFSIIGLVWTLCWVTLEDVWWRWPCLEFSAMAIALCNIIYNCWANKLQRCWTRLNRAFFWNAAVSENYKHLKNVTRTLNAINFLLDLWATNLQRNLHQNLSDLSLRGCTYFHLCVSESAWIDFSLISRRQYSPHYCFDTELKDFQDFQN